MSRISSIGLLGLGEVGGILAADLAGAGVELAAYDVAFGDSSSRSARTLRSHSHVTGTASAGEMARGRDLVISAVTADEDLPAAASVADALAPGAWFLDLNSVSPDMRCRVARVVEQGGGRYVEAAVMAPFAPARLATPILLGGPHAEAFLPGAAALGFSGARFCDGEVGRAAAVKMCRSIIVKGLEALVSESLLTARHYRVEEEILENLEALFPRGDWPEHARYLIGRTLEHGARRAEEMSHAAETVRQAGITPWMSKACEERQAWAPAHAAALEHEQLDKLLDALLTAEWERPPGREPGASRAGGRSHQDRGSRQEDRSDHEKRGAE